MKKLIVGGLAVLAAFLSIGTPVAQASDGLAGYYIWLIEQDGFAVPDHRVGITIYKGELACYLIEERGFTRGEASTALMYYYDDPASFTSTVVQAATEAYC